MENLRIEYKGRLDQPVWEGLGSDIAAYANAKGGEIWFGVDDKARPTGVLLTEVDRQRVAQKAARCQPPVPIDLEEREYEGHQITVAIVPDSPSIHADDRHRFPIRVGGIKTYLDAMGILLLAREKRLEFASGEANFEHLFRRGPKIEQERAPQDVAHHFISGLLSDNPVVRAETLKDLDAAVYRYRLEDEARILESLIALGGRLSEPSDGRPLDLLRYILLRASEEDKAQWAPRIRETALAVYRRMSPAFAVQQAINFLSEFPDAQDVETIASTICTCPKELYAQAKPLTWLQGLKSKGYLFQAQQALFRRLDQAENPDTIERIKECLDQLRRN